MIGTTLGRYRIVEKLGEGGMGVVYRAKDTSLDRDVALKVLARDVAENSDRRKRFEREARAVAALNHPNIVTIHAVEEVDDSLFLALELVLGRTLSELQPDGGFTVKQFLNYAIPLTDAIAVAHEHGITHRDLKPDNIMVTERGTLKVLDFGLARLLEESVDPEFAPTLTQEGVVVGTVPYMSPEQLEGRAVDHRTDLFSLGVIFYEMLADERPFDGDSNASLMSAILTRTPRLVSDVRRGIDPGLARVISQCLEKKAGHRYESADEVRLALAEVQRRIVSRESRSSSSTRVATRRRMIAVLPFENLGEAQDPYFAQGITDEVTTRLSAVDGLGVISSKSANQYAGTEKTPQEIGAELGVDYLVEGTVRWAGNRTRIAPRLIRASEDTQVWGDTFDRTLDDIFEIQSELAGKIIDALGIALHASDRATLEVQYTDNVEAYRALLRGREAWGHYTESSVRQAIREFDTAIELDPGFARAWMEKAMCLGAMVHFGFERTDAQRALAREAAEQVGVLEPDSALSHLAMGYYHYHCERHLRTAEFLFGLAEKDAALRSEARGARAYILRRLGRPDEAERLMSGALEMNPRDARLMMDLANTLMCRGKFDRARELFERACEVSPEVGMSRGMLSWLEMLVGDLDAAKRHIDQVDSPGDPVSMFRFCTILLARTEFQELLDRAKSLPDVAAFPPHILPVDVYRGFALRGLAREAEAKEAFESARAWLETRRLEDPSNTGYPGPLGLVHAALGDRRRAMENLMIGLDLYPPETDSFFGPMIEEFTAWGYAVLGDNERALEILERLLRTEGALLTREGVRVDPRWEPLRRLPRYVRMMEGS